MRVLIATESYWPTVSGVSVFSESLARNLIADGHKAAIVCPNDTHHAAISVQNGLPIFRAPSLPSPFRKDTRLAVQQGPFIRRVMKEFQPDIIHLQAPFGVTTSCRRYAKRHGIPLIATNHFYLDFVLAYLKGLETITPITRRFLIRYLRTFYKPCSVITCPTETVAKELRGYRLNVPVVAISNGVDILKYRPGLSPASPAFMRLRLSPDQPVVLGVGRLDPDKNIPFALETVERLIPVSNAQFVFVGGGTMLRSCRRWARERGLERRVRFIGTVHPGSVLLRELYASAQVFFLPASIETQSIVALEAMASGVPLVAGNGGAIPELVRSGETGYLTDPHNPEEAAHYLGRLIDDTELARQMGQAARRLIEDEHDIRCTMRQFVELYKIVLEEFTAAPVDSAP